ncbi:MAG: type II toxin-antitoxin system RelE/ParE family toxin [Gammaproteobacteria bacterium]|nr:type II toxin-antitoxin system RelE/ParE family toxin [Gammaproteobacteria bacterium]
MSLTLRLSRQTGRFVKTLPPKQYKQVVSTIFSLLNNPKPHDSQVLRGSQQNNRRVDVGEYRIVYRVEGEELLVLVAGKRNDDDIYKQLKRLK